MSLDDADRPADPADPGPLPAPHARRTPPAGVPGAPAALDGSPAWWCGLVTLLCIPVLSNVVAVVAVLVYRSAARERLTPTGAEVVRRAANWQLSLLLYVTVLITVHVVVLASGAVEGASFLPFGLVILTALGLLVYNAVLCVLGAARASTGRLVAVPLALPLLR
ncbi:DUF4870 domain-containing protein [Cellulomonas oligotrophica]|uniref:Putative Tic20 family protein n=1 Tax=Cellulomonas oligotrophica TaxID=931536 RepID=A0A7Y9FER5_9CELL|nr:DUF4870 domain-containing protein [Cellulomonas oligotrophica]NYD85945.1 putative Tic20 family protein [Cellulomonas oligotrophica]